MPGTIVQSHGQSRRPGSHVAAATAWHTYGSQAPSRIAQSGLRTSFQRWPRKLPACSLPAESKLARVWFGKARGEAG